METPPPFSSVREGLFLTWSHHTVVVVQTYHSMDFVDVDSGLALTVHLQANTLDLINCKLWIASVQYKVHRDLKYNMLY